MTKQQQIEKLFNTWVNQKIKEMADNNAWQPNESENK
jgi:hypothetical protein